jgi:hypothetical protein
MVELTPNVIVKKAEFKDNMVTVTLLCKDLYEARTPQIREAVKNYVVKKFKMYDAVQFGYEDTENFDGENKTFEVVYNFKNRNAVK